MVKIDTKDSYIQLVDSKSLIIDILIRQIKLDIDSLQGNILISIVHINDKFSRNFGTNFLSLEWVI